MTRQRFPNHADVPPRLSAKSGETYQPSSLVLPAGQQIFADGTTKTWIRQRPALAHPQRNSHNDPVTVALLLDGMLRLEHDHVLRAKPLADLLNEQYPQLLWDAVTVGKILASLSEAAKASGAPETELPLERGVTSGAAFFAFRPSVLNWRWLASLRHAMGRKAEEVIQTERKLGKAIARPDFPWDAFAEVEWGK